MRPDGDLYFSIIEMSPDGQHVVVRVIWQPGQMWLWIVGPMIAIGSWIAIWPTRRRAEARVPAGAVVAP